MTEPKKYHWYMEAICEDGYEWHYHVMAEALEAAVAKLKAHWKSEDTEEKTIVDVSGPFEPTDVLAAREPNL